MNTLWFEDQEVVSRKVDPGKVSDGLVSVVLGVWSVCVLGGWGRGVYRHRFQEDDLVP